MSAPRVPAARDVARTRLVEVAAELLATGGPGAVTTRSVAHAAGVQPPMIYRLFGDKNGLLDAVTEHGFTSYLAAKPPVDTADDPIAGLRAGWLLHVGFGLAHPALFRLMHTAVRTSDGQQALDSGVVILRERVRQVARIGRLRVAEHVAVDLIHSVGTGIVLTLIDQPEDERDEALAELGWESVCVTILTDAPAAHPGPVAAAVTLRAALPETEGFTAAERALFGDWLDRVTSTRSGLRS